jgi:hypothetical protein
MVARSINFAKPLHVLSWHINIELNQQVEQEERRILMALSQAYLEWEKQTEHLGYGEERHSRSFYY